MKDERKTKAQLIKELQEARRQAEIFEGSHRKPTDSSEEAFGRIEKLLHDTGERVKELEGLYGVARAIAECASLEEMFQRTAELIPPAWHYPEITRSRVVFEGQEYVSESFDATRWMQTADLRVAGEVRGAIEVYYLEECPELDEGPFLAEERKLIDGLADLLAMAASRKQAEEALRESQHQYEMIADNINDVIWLFDLSTSQTTFCTPSIERLTGFTPEEIMSFPLDRLYPPQSIEKIMKFITEGIAEAETKKDITQQAELLAYHKDGSLVWVEIVARLIMDENGNPKGILGTTRDITERKQTEEALQEKTREAQLLAEMLDSSSQPFAVGTPEGRLIKINPAFCQMTGYSEVELLENVSWNETLTPLKWREYEGKILHEVITTGKPQLFEKEYIRKDGKVISVELLMHRRSDAAGNLENVFGFINDITERKQAEEALLASNVHLEEATARANELAIQAEHANAAKSEFLANMSHEIRTPMNGVIGMTGLLLDTDLSDEQHYYAEAVRTSAESLLGLINDILDISKIEAGKLELETLDFDLRILLDDVSEMMAFRAKEKDLEFSCAAAPEVPVFLQGDPGRLRQVLVNLMGNAIKFTSAGEVAVRVHLEQETEDDVVLHVSVSDTGIGIPADKFDLLFDKFTQVDASTTRNYGGTGLGLAISKQLVEAMGGKIGVESDEGQGSDFWFTARLVKQQQKERYLTPPPELREARVSAVNDNATNRSIRTRHSIRELQRGAVRILLAEDNITNQQVALSILNKLGLAADAVACGSEAIKALESIPYDLVLMDVQMPEMDGYEATAKIRDPQSKVRNHDIPIIAMTAHVMQGDRKKCLEAGMNDFLSKPVVPQALVEMLEKWLPEQKGNSGPRETKGSASGGPQETACPIFDKSALLNRLMDDEDLAQTIIAGFLGDIPEQIEKLKDYLQSGDASGAERQAHTIKGASANVSGEALSEVAFGLEKAVLAGDFDVAKAGLPALEAQFEKLKEAMKD